MSSLSKPLNVSRLAKEGVEVDLALSSTVAEDLAKACEVEAVRKLGGSLTVRPWRKTGFSVRGVMKAEITQLCAVTLEPIAESLEEEIERYFLPEADIARNEAPDIEEVEVFLDSPDPPEPLYGQEISLFEIVREQILLSKSLYPRSEGVALEEGDSGASEGHAEKESPFAALKVLQGGKSGEN